MMNNLRKTIIFTIVIRICKLFFLVGFFSTLYVSHAASAEGMIVKKIDKYDDDGLTLLMKAIIIDQDPKEVQKLLAQGASANKRAQLEKNVQPDATRNQNTPLHMAIFNGNVGGTRKIVKLLLKAGANVNFYNDRGEQPIHLLWMIENNDDSDKRLDILKMLVCYGADINSQIIDKKKLENYKIFVNHKIPKHAIGNTLAHIMANTTDKLFLLDMIENFPKLNLAIKNEAKNKKDKKGQTVQQADDTGGDVYQSFEKGGDIYKAIQKAKKQENENKKLTKQLENSCNKLKAILFK